MEPRDTPQPQTPPMAPIPPTPQTKNSLVLILSVLLIISVGIAGLFYFQIQKLSKELSKYQTQASPTPTATTDPTANWKTYTNSFYSIKYPNVWNIADKTDTFVEFVKTNGLFDTVTQKNTSLTISATPKSLNYAGCPNPYDSTHTLIIGGEQLILGVQKQKEQYVGSVTDTATRCWFAKNKINYGIHFYSRDDVSEEITQILSTFKFMEATPSTSPTSY